MRLDHSLRLYLWRRYHREPWWPWLPWLPAILLPAAALLATAWMVAGQGG
jgi:hypothetical protein